MNPHPYEVANIQHWTTPIPGTAGRIVAVAPHGRGTLFQVYYYPGPGYAGQQHYTNGNTQEDAFVGMDHAVAYYAGTAPNAMGRWFK